MATIVIAGEVDLAPEHRAAALAGAQPLIEQALAEEGCRHYAWTADPVLPGRLHVFEEWASAEALEAHFKHPSYLGMLAHLGGFGILAAHTRKYRVDATAAVYNGAGVPTASFDERPIG